MCQQLRKESLPWEDRCVVVAALCQSNECSCTTLSSSDRFILYAVLVTETIIVRKQASLSGAKTQGLVYTSIPNYSNNVERNMRSWQFCPKFKVRRYHLEWRCKKIERCCAQYVGSVHRYSTLSMFLSKVSFSFSYLLDKRVLYVHYVHGQAVRTVYQLVRSHQEITPKMQQQWDSKQDCDQFFFWYYSIDFCKCVH